MSNANEEFDKQDSTTNDVLPEGSDTIDDSYVSDDGDEIPVIPDEEPVEQPNLVSNPDSKERIGMH